MIEKMVQFSAEGGQSASGFLATPEGTGPFPAVVVIQEWWGLNENIKQIARRFAGEGFVALAPDLFHGTVVSEPNLAQKEAMALDRPRAIHEIIGAVRYLKGLDNVSPKAVGVAGFCMGGGLALAAAAESNEVGAVVSFYGGGAPGAEAFGHNKAPILAILGEKDEWVTNNIKEMLAGCDSAGYSFKREVVVYPGAQHAFFNDSRPEVYDPVAATDSWKRALAFFHAELK